MELEREKIKLAETYCKIIRETIPQVTLIYEDLVYIDFLYSRHLFHNNWKLTRPIYSNNYEIILKDYFHPLIDNCKTNSLTIEKNSHGLIISGPNTGGKTVVLKSILSIQMMYQKALFVPAKKAFLFCFDAIFYHGSDQQDLIKGLSSFSAEVLQFDLTFQNLTQNNLLICDEIFNSTSSAEASVLAYSLLEQIMKLYPKTKVILSTHHETLKNLFFQNKNYQTAHMSFDSQMKEPTYRLIEGPPGNSFALEIFQKHFKGNLKNKILEDAKGLLDDDYQDIEKLSQRLIKEEARMIKAKDSIEEKENAILKREAEIQGLLTIKENELKSNYYKLEQEFKKQAYDLLDKIKKGERVKQRSVSSLLKIEKEQDIPIPSLEPPLNFEIGQFYYSAILNQDVLLKNIKNEMAEVTVGKMKSKVPLNTLFISKKKNTLTDFSFSISKESTSSLSIDCRGLRLDDFQTLVIKSLSDLRVDNLPYLEIIHGHGTGILKNWLRSYMKKNEDFYIEENNNGNDGQTIIKLKS